MKPDVNLNETEKNRVRSVVDTKIFNQNPSHSSATRHQYTHPQMSASISADWNPDNEESIFRLRMEEAESSNDWRLNGSRMEKRDSLELQSIGADFDASADSHADVDSLSSSCSEQSFHSPLQNIDGNQMKGLHNGSGDGGINSDHSNYGVEKEDLRSICLDHVLDLDGEESHKQEEYCTNRNMASSFHNDSYNENELRASEAKRVPRKIKKGRLRKNNICPGKMQELMEQPNDDATLDRSAQLDIKLPQAPTTDNLHREGEYRDDCSDSTTHDTHIDGTQYHTIDKELLASKYDYDMNWDMIGRHHPSPLSCNGNECEQDLVHKQEQQHDHDQDGVKFNVNHSEDGSSNRITLCKANIEMKTITKNNSNFCGEGAAAATPNFVDTSAFDDTNDTEKTGDNQIGAFVSMDQSAKEKKCSPVSFSPQQLVENDMSSSISSASAITTTSTSNAIAKNSLTQRNQISPPSSSGSDVMISSSSQHHKEEISFWDQQSSSSSQHDALSVSSLPAPCIRSVVGNTYRKYFHGDDMRRGDLEDIQSVQTNSHNLNYTTRDGDSNNTSSINHDKGPKFARRRTKSTPKRIVRSSDTVGTLQTGSKGNSTASITNNRSWGKMNLTLAPHNSGDDPGVLSSGNKSTRNSSLCSANNMVNVGTDFLHGGQLYNAAKYQSYNPNGYQKYTKNMSSKSDSDSRRSTKGKGPVAGSRTPMTDIIPSKKALALAGNGSGTGRLAEDDRLDVGDKLYDDVSWRWNDKDHNSATKAPSLKKNYYRDTNHKHKDSNSFTENDIGGNYCAEENIAIKIEDFTATPVNDCKYPHSAPTSSQYSVERTTAAGAPSTLSLSLGTNTSLYQDTVSEMNESINTLSNESVTTRTTATTNTSSSQSASMTHRRRRVRGSPGFSGGLHLRGHLRGRLFTSPAAMGMGATARTQFPSASNNGSGLGIVGRGGALGQQHRGSANSSPIQEIDPNDAILNDNQKSSPRSLRSSLDSGMAALKRWVHSRTAATASATQVGPRPSRAAMIVQRQNNDLDGSGSIMSLGEEDFFALAHAGDPRKLISSSDERCLETNRSWDSERDNVESRPDGSSSGHTSSLIIYPPPIVEEDEPSRQRAFSEPDRSRTRAWFVNRNVHSTTSDNILRRSQKSSSFKGNNNRRRRNSRVCGSNSCSSSSGGSDVDAVGTRITVASNIGNPQTIPSATRSTSHYNSRSSSPQQNQNETPSSESRYLQRSTAPVSQLGNQFSSGSSDQNVRYDSDQQRIARDVDGSDNEDTERGPDELVSTLDDSSLRNDPNREARRNWILINQRFQLIITIVALIFSFLLFSILVCWVVLTSAYVISIDKACDIPLKSYFWLATLQLILDVFRTDIMRFVFRWDSNSRRRIPGRVVVYNIAYLTYAMLVLRMGVASIFLEDNTSCSKTAPELYQTSSVFITLSLAAWSTIILGYLGPFCFVAIILTRNGYSPTLDINDVNESQNRHFGVFPAGFSINGAPPECIDRMRMVMLEEFPEEYPKECCICLHRFKSGEVIVATECEHVFHKRCFQEWLRQARTCPVCRTDIPDSLNIQSEEDGSNQSIGSRNETPSGMGFPPGFVNGQERFQEVANIFGSLRQNESRQREQSDVR